MEEALKRAQKGGYTFDDVADPWINEIHLLRPSFWQALSKAEEWTYKNVPMAFEADDPIDLIFDWTPEIEWKVHQKDMLDHTNAGKPIDEFFNTLLK